MRTRVVPAVMMICVVGFAAAACVPSPPPVIESAPAPAPRSGTAGRVMARSRVSASEMASWFRSKTSSRSRASVSVDRLAAMFLEEGNAEGVTGDVAFVQAMLETGWLTFPDHGQVKPEYNNFAGIGAVDGGSAAGPAAFKDARTGVRAQIQHLRVYSDPHVTRAKLAHPLVDPRFYMVRPPGKAPNWSQYGAGVWATDPTYAAKIEKLYSEMLRYARR